MIQGIPLAIRKEPISENNFFYKALACTPFIGNMASFYFRTSLNQQSDEAVSDGIYFGRNLQDRFDKLDSVKKQFHKCALVSSLLSIAAVVAAVVLKIFPKYNIFLNPYVFAFYLLFEVYLIQTNYRALSERRRDYLQ